MHVPLLLGSSILAMDCSAPTNSGIWHGSTAFSLEERATIQEAQDWLCAQVEDECAPIIWDRAPGDRSYHTIVKDRAPSSPDSPVGAEYTGGRIFLPSDYCLRGMAAHEFGHWRKLDHLPEGETGLMAPTIVTDTLEWSAADERECARVSCRIPPPNL
jgi:hypothetical protein